MIYEIDKEKYFITIEGIRPTTSETYNPELDVENLSNNIKELEACKKWIHSNWEKSNKINTSNWSYTFKHSVEKECKLYIPNGIFILTAIQLGYKIQPECPNAYFAYKELNKNE